MKKSTFRVLICEAQPIILVLFARISYNLTLRQRAHLLKLGGAA
ncbi:hypothetical protein Rin_00004420 [Candidatus Regiella insecticola 5.15]|uniref:Uncharacterized protein n=1 Tax=Candidatus Regiella insecticola 5.15 TaxID=1005043 RepID=G2GXF0_9ENTR|nr:hypothetical protein Rin_00004420 [Candidatus Regiella insecticola 5.15]